MVKAIYIYVYMSRCVNIRAYTNQLYIRYIYMQYEEELERIAAINKQTGSVQQHANFNGLLVGR